MAKITGYTKRDQISENVGYWTGYILGTVYYFLKWGTVGAILTIIGHCILH
jgi:hypothetical protein